MNFYKADFIIYVRVHKAMRKNGVNIVTTQTCAIILAAGQGTRMKSKHPKAMCEVLFKPMICWVTDWCRKAGIEKICVVVGEGAQEIEAVLPEGCVTVLQSERKGTGHAVMMAKEFIQENIDSDIVVLNADAPFVNDRVLRESLDQHRTEDAKITVITAKLDHPTGYGRLIRSTEDDKVVTAIVEEKDATEEQRAIKEVNSGAYWFSAKFLQDALTKIDCNNSQHEYYLPDTVKVAFSQGEKVIACLCDDPNLVLGANDRAGLLKLNEIANKIVVDRLLEDGVNFYCTDGIVISPDVTIGRDTTIAPGTQLIGHVEIGEDCVIGPNTIIENSQIGNGCQIHSSFIEKSKVGNGVRIGPNSHLRPNSVLADSVKIGNFVEIKNSTLGEKTSVAHLTYIGDSDFGSHINVGCGVVTVNYNGYRKFRSIVEDNAFIGCNTNLVSPVHVGKGAYIAAGSTITDDVQEEELAIARARQTNKQGWVAGYREKELALKAKSSK